MPVVIVAIVFGTVLLIVKMGLEFGKQKMLAQRDSNGSSIRVSELEAMIDSAVSDAIEPLVARVDELESEKLLATSKELLLEEGDRLGESTTSSSSPAEKVRS
jgi:hypothetical protein